MMRWIAPASFLLIAVAAGITVAFVKALQPTSAGAYLFFAVWLLFPYAIMSAVLISLRRRGAVPPHWYGVADVVSIGGILLLADIIFWHPDAQGAIAVLMTPIVQAGASVLLLPVASWVTRHG